MDPISVLSRRLADFETAHFEPRHALGNFGTAGRNTTYGPGIANLDAGLFKQIPIAEQRRFELRWEVFNTLNRPNFLNPNSSLQSTSFGRITAACDPRIMQVAA